MILPSNDTDDGRRARNSLFVNLVRECEESRAERQGLHRRMRTIYLNGSESDVPDLYNRILEFVDTSSAYLYDPEGARLVVETEEKDRAVDLGGDEPDDFSEEESAATDYLQKLWLQRYTLTVSQMVEWAHPYPSTVCKVFGNKGRTAVRMLSDPADFGVWREGLDTLEEQEAMVHHYVMDLPSFERYLESLALGPALQAELLMAAKEHSQREAGPAGNILPPAQSRIILAAVTPNAIGAAQAAPIVSMATPNSGAAVVPMTELWVWDDRLDDWQVVTMFRPTETVLFERANPQPGIDPFYKLTLFPTAGYIWGLAPIERMVGLQEWRERRMRDIDANTVLQLDPPRAYLGISGMTDEKAERLRAAGGHFHNAVPGGDIKSLAPTMPPDAWTLVDGIDRMFNRFGGLPAGADVQSDQANMRAGDQLETAANLGAPRTRRRAMYVESFVNAVGTAILRMERRRKVVLVKPQAKTKFLLADMPGDITATVAAHSASPLYAEQTFQKALLMTDRAAITKEALVMLSGLPMQRRLRADARRISEAESEHAAKVQDVKSREAESKILKNVRASK